ncbi:hypothetical protein AMECASPLE_012915 [Ameca splendens]|uniref:Secreted protein n=1 Tax=Ameca splendens TaxID=208324 RepID=A0ABV0XQ37_9TELE
MLFMVFPVPTDATSLHVILSSSYASFMSSYHTYRQSIAGQHRDTQDKKHVHTLRTKRNLERIINRIVMFLQCWRTPLYPKKTHAPTGKTWKLHAERPHTEIKTQSGVCCAVKLCLLNFFHPLHLNKIRNKHEYDF